MLTTLCYIEKDDKYLMLHRVKKVNDENHDKWIGVGGKFEAGESPEDCLLREVWEETGIRVEDPKLCGIKQFPTENDERYVVLFFKATKFSGELKSSDEGEALWVPRSELLKQKLVRGFEEMLTVFESDEISEVFWNKGEEDCLFF